MLYILYGPDVSGKKCFRDLLADTYGFKIIGKYTSETFDDNQTFQYKNEGYRRRKKDPYLLIAPEGSEIYRLMKEDLERFKANKSLSGSELGTYLVYERPKNDNNVFYGIRRQDLCNASNDENSNYLLVCSHGQTIDTIQTLGIDFKCILLLGYKQDGHHQRSPEEGTNKVLDYFIKNMGHFYYIIYNKYEKGKTGPQIREALIKEWERYTDLPNYKQSTNGGIFFIKPFSTKNSTAYKLAGNEDELERHKFIYHAINKKIAEIVNGINNDSTGGAKLTNIKALTVDKCKSAQREQKPVIEELMTSIDASNLVIADLADILDNAQSEHKPNCYWEIGYARAKMKELIVLADQESIDDIPFDEKGFDCLSYQVKLDNTGSYHIEFEKNQNDEYPLDEKLKTYLTKYKQTITNIQRHLDIMNTAST